MFDHHLYARYYDKLSDRKVDKYMMSILKKLSLCEIRSSTLQNTSWSFAESMEVFF